MEFVWKESDDTRLAGATPSIGSVVDGERALVQWNWRKWVARKWVALAAAQHDQRSVHNK
jgi:hypothetical protein